jgi:enoyl-CoA hydratase/carnithine racemase
MSVTVSELGSARVVTWDRQANRNAWTRDTIEGIADAIEAAGADESVRCVIARGAGEHFSAGDDLFAAIEATPESWAATVAAFQRVTSATLAAPVPVIAAIDGVCIGGAFEFACSCDLRVASTRSRFACPEVGIGLVISNASTVLLPRLCGAGYASELMLTGRLIGAQEAFDNGILNAVVEPAEVEAGARALADEIAARAPLAVAATKRLLVDVLGPAVEKAMARETEALVRLVPTADMREGFAAFREKRPPSFSGE